MIATLPASRVARPDTAAYGASQSRPVNATQTLAVELAPKVRVNAVVVGLVVTEQAHLFYGDEEGPAVGATVPLGRMAEPADVADVCLFLASPLARFTSPARRYSSTAGGEAELHGCGELKRNFFMSQAQIRRPGW